MELNDLSDKINDGALIIESLPSALYQAYFQWRGTTYPLTREGTAVRTYSLGKVYEILGDYRFREAWLRQRSAYDEMIGQPRAESPDGNTMMIPLDWSPDAFLMASR